MTAHTDARFQPLDAGYNSQLMSLITRCPACGTMFKVVPDQLRISEGWVRCGHCADVFDASAHLLADEAAPPAPAAEPAAQTVAAAPEEVPDASEGFESSIHTELDEDLAAGEFDPAELDAQAQALKENPLDAPFVLRREDPADAPDVRQADDDRSIPQVSWAAPAAVSTSSETEPELDDLSFVRQARRRAFWQQTPVRSGAVALLAGLVLLLLLQVAVHERDRLAAFQPAAGPLLDTLCQPFGCSVAALRQIDAIAVESSSFNRLRADAFRLQVALRNQSALDVAMPALELTLTDGQDHPVVRRVLLPADLQHAGVIAAGGEWTSSFSLAIAPNPASPARIAGYRLLAFYP